MKPVMAIGGQRFGFPLLLIASVGWFTGLAAGMGKVLELSDRFLPLRNEGMWLMQFYAPWCGHCKKLEPIWKHVAQSLADVPVRVGRVDCTRFTTVANEFNVRGFPTIMFLKGEDTHVYEGDRSREDIVAFAQRMMGPPVKQITGDSDLDEAKQRSDLFFIYIGRPAGRLWNEYYMNAKHYQRDEFMYASTVDVMVRHVQLGQDPCIYVFKDNQYFLYDDKLLLERVSRSSEITGDPQTSSPTVEVDVKAASRESDDGETGTTIDKSPFSAWINRERFPLFVKITRGKFSNILNTKKLIVIAVLEENKLEKITPEMEEFRDMIRTIVETNPGRYHDHFQFGWTGLPELANSVAMEHLEIPSLLVINSTTFQHHLPEDDARHITPEAVEIFLAAVQHGQAPIYGGSSWMVRLYRAYFEAKSSLTGMWRGNPVLTSVLLGLPLGFLSLIFYSICCADIMDAEEEEDEDFLHEKND